MYTCAGFYMNSLLVRPEVPIRTIPACLLLVVFRTNYAFTCMLALVVLFSFARQAFISITLLFAYTLMHKTIRINLKNALLFDCK